MCSLARRPSSGDAIAGFALSFLAIIPAFGLLFGLIGITCSEIAMQRDSTGRRLAVAGLTIGITFLLTQVISTVALLFCSLGCRIHH